MCIQTFKKCTPINSLKDWKTTSIKAIINNWVRVTFPITAPKDIKIAAEQKSDVNRLEKNSFKIISIP